MDLALRSTKWKNVRKRIRIAIEEEKKRNTTILIQTVDDVGVGDVGKVEESGADVLVTVSAGDSGLAYKGGAK